MEYMNYVNLPKKNLQNLKKINNPNYQIAVTKQICRSNIIKKILILKYSANLKIAYQKRGIKEVWVMHHT